MKIAQRRPHAGTLTTVVVALAVMTCTGLLGPLAPAIGATRHRGAPNVAAQRSVALLFAAHTVYRAPRGNATVMEVVAQRRPITGERTALPVLGRTTNRRGVTWLKVMLPGRPNGSTGWIRGHLARLTETPWHLIVDLRARTVTADLEGVRQRVFRAVVGKPTTPTPTGAFFVEETVTMPADDPGGPFALALSARSDVLQQFDGGPGQIAIHGRDGLGGTLGAAQSHGCVRLADTSVTWLARRIGPGVPVTIVAG